MLTIFTTPKPFNGPIEIIQTNAIMSWTKLVPKVKIVLIGKDLGVREFAKKYNLRHIDDVLENGYGTPLLDSIFKKAEVNSDGEALAYVNADIILSPNFTTIFETIKNRFKKYLIVGQRTDIDFRKLLDFNDKKKTEQIFLQAKDRGQLHGPGGIDYFIYPRGLWGKVPPFGLGRLYWDHWLIWRARKQGAAVIDSTEAITALHQNHDYIHAGGLDSEQWKKERRVNLLLAGYNRMTLEDANYVYNGINFKKRFTLKRDLQRKFRPMLDSTFFQLLVWAKWKMLGGSRR